MANLPDELELEEAETLDAMKIEDHTKPGEIESRKKKNSAENHL